MCKVRERRGVGAARHDRKVRARIKLHTGLPALSGGIRAGGAARGRRLASRAGRRAQRLAGCRASEGAARAFSSSLAVIHTVGRKAKRIVHTATLRVTRRPGEGDTSGC